MAAAKPAGPAGTQWIAVEVATFHRFSKTPKSHSSGLVPAKCNRSRSCLPFFLTRIQTDPDQGPLTQSCKQQCFRIAGLCSGFGLGNAPLPEPQDPLGPSWNQTGSVEKRNFGLPRPGDQTLAEKSSNIGLWENLTAFWDLLQILFKKVCVSLFSILWSFWSILQLFHSWLFALPAGTVIPNPGKPLHRLSWDAEVSETASFCLAGQGKSQVLLSFKMFLQHLQQVTDPCRHLHAPQTA